MLTAYKNLKRPQNTTGGLSDTVLIAPVSWFSKIASNSAVEGINTWASIYDSHMFLAGKGFVQLQGAAYKQQFAAALNGAPEMGIQEQALKFSVHGSYAQLHATLASWHGEALIVLVKDGNCSANMYYQLGNKDVFAWITASEFSTGENKGASKGYDLTIKSVGRNVATYYGAVDLLPHIRVINFVIREDGMLMAVGEEEDLLGIDLSFTVSEDMILTMTGTPPIGYTFSLDSSTGQLIVHTP